MTTGLWVFVVIAVAMVTLLSDFWALCDNVYDCVCLLL
jgi:hypothetical protein